MDEDELTEPMARVVARMALEQYGTLSTEEMKKVFTEFYEPTPLDLIPKSRKEPRYLQTIGNVVSHQKKSKIREYQEGFEVEKFLGPNGDRAIWRLIEGAGDEIRLSDLSDAKRKRLVRRRQMPKPVLHTDWNAINANRNKIGSEGEAVVMEIERNRVATRFPDDVHRVQHTSKVVGDGTGYDILSFEDDGRTRYIEVKTTISLDPNEPFYLSPREYSFLADHYRLRDAWIARVYGLYSVDGPMVDLLSAEEVLDDFDFLVTQFKASRK
ncbi:DUF3883 domain-containing protein [Weissella confusa]|uniref:DUF3883 domain-containing protein n=1 Tax=Weissella fermenti TaxID=2987699 RepID=A0ABT6D4M9_9LACO|nr:MULTISPECIES: DUF3883 domain-containing protein [Weissella]MBJ7689334.1 DUF3883 domain-containing protein [Weissella confusa]MCW0925957.1 DUF3883 domain-containing protein [Weissella sp. LMG 11983]MDF9300493.1 DUF3883 domain-containing protein [Weissella sp. BK2]